jgi:HK97 family phage portal protein
MLLYRLSSRGKKTEVTEGELLRLLKKPNPYWTWHRLISMTEQCLLLWGSAFWFVDRGNSGVGTAREIHWARSDRVRVVPSSDRSKYIAGFIYTSPSGREIPFRPSETVWLRYSNPLDEYAGLAPLLAAKLAADTARAAAASNNNLFKNGIMAGGLVLPKEGGNLTVAQAQAIQEDMERRFKGLDQAHKWGVLRFDARWQPIALSPRDAEFLGSLNWSLQEIARAFGIPEDLVGGRRTYENRQSAERAIWTDTIRPEAVFIAEELTQQLLPMFPGEADLMEFSLDDVDVLQEDEKLRWTITKEKILHGWASINALKKEAGEDTVPWGDVWWATKNVQPIDSNELPEPVLPPGLLGGPSGDPGAKPEGGDPKEPPKADEPKEDPEGSSGRSRVTSGTIGERTSGSLGTIGEHFLLLPSGRAIEFGSEEHAAAWEKRQELLEPLEERLTDALESLFRRQQQAVIDRLRLSDIKTSTRSIEEATADPFAKEQWIKEFRTTARPILQDTIGTSGQAAFDDLQMGTSFDSFDPNSVRFLENRTQRFATAVNATTYSRLQKTLGEGMAKGEGFDQLKERVTKTMGARIRDAEAIAITEVNGAANGGTLLSWKESGVVLGKTWLAALDSRTRPEHAAAHGQEVELDAPFS